MRRDGSRWRRRSPSSLGACTFGTESETPPSRRGPARAPGEPVTLKIWSHRSHAFNAALKEAADAYTAEHPEVTFKFEDFQYDQYIQTLQTALPAGERGRHPADVRHVDVLATPTSWRPSPRT